MQFQVPPQSGQLSVVKREDKEQNLKDFIKLHLAQLLSRADLDPAERCLTVLARSPASPVAKAVIASASLLAAEGFGVRCIFTRLDPPEELAAWLTPAGVALRFAKPRRLIDAHEQLVMGTTSSWTGDCMRREPSKRDAFELFHLADKTAAFRAGFAFEKIWSTAEALPPARITAALRRQARPLAIGMADSLTAPLQLAAESQGQAMGATRH